LQLLLSKRWQQWADSDNKGWQAWFDHKK
jgi:hypothetical protein